MAKKPVLSFSEAVRLLESWMEESRMVSLAFAAFAGLDGDRELSSPDVEASVFRVKGKIQMVSEAAVLIEGDGGASVRIWGGLANPSPDWAPPASRSLLSDLESLIPETAEVLEFVFASGGFAMFWSHS